MTDVVTLSLPKGWFDKLTMTSVVTLSLPKGSQTKSSLFFNPSLSMFKH